MIFDKEPFAFRAERSEGERRINLRFMAVLCVLLVSLLMWGFL